VDKYHVTSLGISNYFYEICITDYPIFVAMGIFCLFEKHERPLLPPPWLAPYGFVNAFGS
jgi:hypothetical protein